LKAALAALALMVVAGCSAASSPPGTLTADAATGRACVELQGVEPRVCDYSMDELVQAESSRPMGVSVSGYLRRKHGGYVLSRDNAPDSLAVRLELDALPAGNPPLESLEGTVIEVAGLYDSTISPARGDVWVYGTLRAVRLVAAGAAD
jgi:hypothetical protein